MGEAREYGLLYPFVAVASKGGPYEDEAFVAGFQAGRVDQALAVAGADLGVESLSFTVATAVVATVELAGMARGFADVSAEPVAAGEGYEAMPQWSVVTFRRSG